MGLMMIQLLIEKGLLIPVTLLTFVYFIYAKKAYIEDKSIKSIILIVLIYSVILIFFLWFNNFFS